MIPLALLKDVVIVAFVFRNVPISLSICRCSHVAVAAQARNSAKRRF